jgi:hypothetical protein
MLSEIQIFGNVAPCRQVNINDVSVDCCDLILGVNTIIRGLLGRADEGNAILREAGNGLSADTV